MITQHKRWKNCLFHQKIHEWEVTYKGYEKFTSHFSTILIGNNDVRFVNRAGLFGSGQKLIKISGLIRA